MRNIRSLQMCAKSHPTHTHIQLFNKRIKKYASVLKFCFNLAITVYVLFSDSKNLAERESSFGCVNTVPFN